MSVPDKVSTGIKGFDGIIDKLRLGDNVVWQVDDIEGYRKVVLPFADQARQDGRQLVYVRFGRHAPLLDEEGVEMAYMDASRGFESFATAVHS
ncbi:MAG: pyruvate kinase, partial [Bacillota bacterium]